MIRLLHVADLHPDNAGTFAGKTVVNPETGLNQSLVDLRSSLNYGYDVATDPSTRCDLAVIPGDLFDSPRPHMNEVRIIRDFVHRLALEMPVFVIDGNHDLSQNPNDAPATICLEGLGNVFVEHRPRTQRIVVRGQECAVSFLPYPTKGHLLTRMDTAGDSPEAITAKINHALADILRGLKASADPTQPHILLAHGSVANAKVGEQPRAIAHDILIPLDELEGFDYVALGHIHAHQQVAPNAWYSGSLMRQSFGEEREEKGFCIVGIEDGQSKVAFCRNPHARTYRTIDHDSFVPGATLDPTVIYRYKAALTEEQYRVRKPDIDLLADRLPYFQQDIQIVKEDRARDAGMAEMPTLEEAIKRIFGTRVTDDELARLLEENARLQTEVSRV